MDRLTQTVSRVLSSLSTSFPDLVFSSHSSNPSEDTLIRESAAEGERFSQYFVTKHGENCAFFMESPIVDAITVSGVEQKPLLLFLSSSLHENEDKLENLLASPSIVEYLKTNFVCWGCDVTTKYGYSLLLEVNFPVPELPAVVLMIKKSETSPLSLLGIIPYKQGMTADSFRTTIEVTVATSLAEIQEAEMERQRLEENRRLAEQQRQEYEAAVAADRERMRESAASESVEETEEDTLPAQASDEASHEEMEILRSRIPAEPIEGDIVRVRIVYPDGTKLQRNFLRSDDVGLLLDLVALDIFDHQLSYKLSELCMTIPKVSIDESMRGNTFSDLNVKGSCVFR
ncbi:hypothetical protein WA588_003375, partial [Blastocystis sp. NMH]